MNLIRSKKNGGRLLKRFLLLELSVLLFALALPPITHANVILGWDPTPSELLSFEYPELSLGDDPGGWQWSASFSHEIQDVYVASTIHPVPYIPVIEYDGTHTTFNVSLNFFSPGIYTTKIDFVDPLLDDAIQFLDVNTYPGDCDAGGCKGDKKPRKRSRTTKIDNPSVDLVIIETPDSDNGFIRNAADSFNNEVRAGSVAEAIQKIKDAFAAKGNKPVSVKIIGHGNKGLITIGDGQSTLDPGKHLFDNDQSVQDFIKELKGKVSSLVLDGCCVAGDVDDSGRDHLMERLADGLGVPVQAWDDIIFWTAPWTIPVIGTVRDGYPSIDVHGKKVIVNAVPEPSSILLFGIGAIPFLARRWRYTEPLLIKTGIG